MAHVKKLKRPDVMGLIIHYERREGCELSNKDIDKTRTHLNYNLAQELQPLKPETFIKKRISEVKHIKRDDIIIMVDWVVTLPKNVPEKDERAFFEHTYDFMKQEYGEKNIICAWVHKDEKTPHIHLGFIPILFVNDIERLNCKKIINKAYLNRFHNRLQDYLEQKLGFKPEILNDATINGNRSIKELKAQEDLSLKKSLRNIHEHIDASEQIQKSINEIDFKSSNIIERSKSLKKCNQIIDELKHTNQQLTAEAKALTNLVTVQKKEIDAYRSMPLAKQLEEKEQTITNMNSSIFYLKEKIDNRESENYFLQKSKEKLDNKVNQLESELNIYQSFINMLGLERIFLRFKKIWKRNDFSIDIKDLKEICEKAHAKIQQVWNSLKDRIFFLDSQQLPSEEITDSKSISYSMTEYHR